MPVSFLKVELNNALPYPIQFDAKRLVEHVIGIRLSVVSLYFIIRKMFCNFS